MSVPGDDDVTAEASEPVRLDRWLWAARLVKTRALAVEAVNGGRVHVNGQRVKPGRDVRPGDELEITLGARRMAVVVRATSVRRGPASEAQRLYEETAEIRAERERHAEHRRLAAAGPQASGARPTKRDRRRFEAGRDARRGGRG